MCTSAHRLRLGIGAPPPVDLDELVLHLLGQVAWRDRTGELDRPPYLGEVLGAVRAGRQMCFEPAPGRAAERPVKVAGHQLDRLLADELAARPQLREQLRDHHQALPNSVSTI